MELSSLVSFAEKQPRTLLIVLLGVIAAGGIGGGLWINSLNSAIEQNKEMVAEKDKKLAQEIRTCRNIASCWKAAMGIGWPHSGKRTSI